MCRTEGRLEWQQTDGVCYVSPAQRHAGDDHAILTPRHALYLQARERNSARWSGRRIWPITIFNRWLHDRGDNYFDAPRGRDCDGYK